MRGALQEGEETRPGSQGERSGGYAGVAGEQGGPSRGETAQGNLSQEGVLGAVVTWRLLRRASKVTLATCYSLCDPKSREKPGLRTRLTPQGVTVRWGLLGSPEGRGGEQLQETEATWRNRSSRSPGDMC